MDKSSLLYFVNTRKLMRAVTGICRAWYNTPLYVWSRGKQFCFPESPDVSRDKVEGNISTSGKTKLTSFSRDHTLSALLYI